ncbi:MAG: hypothetical protein WC324_00520 [Candidatus Omnitrophota bacterium]|jgi:hypothetical protein
MEKKPYVFLKVLLWLVALYHIAGGIAATFSQQFALQLGYMLFGVNISITPETQVLVRYLGAFAVTFGLLMVFAALDPAKNRKIVYGGIAYFLIRAFDRVVFWKVISECSAGPLPNWGRIALILFFGIALFVLRPKSE